MPKPRKARSAVSLRHSVTHALTHGASPTSESRPVVRQEVAVIRCVIGDDARLTQCVTIDALRHPPCLMTHTVTHQLRDRDSRDDSPVDSRSASRLTQRMTHEARGRAASALRHDADAVRLAGV